MTTPREPVTAASIPSDGAQAAIDHDRALSALVDFPAPLIVVGRTHGTVISNLALRAKFGSVRLDVELIMQAVKATAGPLVFTLEPVGTGAPFMVSAMATDLADWHVLLIGDAADEINVQALRRLVRMVLELERDAAIDKLTGTWNRARFDRVIRPEIELPRVPTGPLTLVLVDIDNFKQVNDQHGRAAGDHVLQQLASFLRQRIRSTDELFRWGGDEFALLIRDASQSIGSRIAEKIRAAVETHEFESVGHIELSAGVAEHAEGEALVAWIGRVDSALYRAKTAGRNRVESEPTSGGDDRLMPSLHLTWLDRYECGEPTIDRQHRELFDLANEVLNEVLRGGRNTVAMVDRLVVNVCNHFADEERLLAEHGYSGLERHKRLHRELTSKLLQLQEAAVSGRTSLGGLVEFLIGQVVSRHLLQEDRRFAGLFRGRDPATAP